MKLRLITSLVLASYLLGCSSTPTGEQVELAITRLPVGNSCYTISWELDLVADPTYGTAYRDGPGGKGPNPLYWPAGYTGWRVGSEVEVRDTTGKVVAVTGRTYAVGMGGTPQGESTEGLVTSGPCIHEQ